MEEHRDTGKGGLVGWVLCKLANPTNPVIDRMPFPSLHHASVLALILAGPLQPAAAQTLEEARDGAAQPMDVRASLDLLVRTLEAQENPEVQARLMQGMLRGLAGQRDVPAPERWTALSGRLGASRSEEVRRMSHQLSQLFGDEDATRKALTTLSDRTADLGARKAALASLIAQRAPEVAALLEPLLAKEALRLEAIRAYSAIDVEEAPTLLLALYPEASPEHQRAILETLATRKHYAEALFEAMQAGRVHRNAVPAYVARSLSTILGDRFTKAYGSTSLPEKKEARIAAYKKLLTPEALAKADASQGRAVFQKTCSVCHLMFGEGETVGPDLTGSNRADLDYILLNILDPSGDIPDAYKLVAVTTRSNRMVAGTIGEEDDQKVVLNMQGQRVTILKNDIKSRLTSDYSMMPDGLLDTLKQEEILDLIKYLQTPQQVDLPR